MSTYQSRVFSFISRRANQLKDTCAKSWRQLKVNVVWSGQILLHPLQILARATKILNPQLPPARQQPALPQPAPDLNIEEALYLIETAGYSIKIAIPDKGKRVERGDTSLALEPGDVGASKFSLLGLFAPTQRLGAIEATKESSSLTYQQRQSNDSAPISQFDRSESSLTYQQPEPTNSNIISTALTYVVKSAEIFKLKRADEDRSLFYDERRSDLSTLDRTSTDRGIANNAPQSTEINAPKPIVCGLSSRLSDRQIVLVTSENELLDILTIPQQQEIRRRIGIDLATIWTEWHSVKLTDRPTAIIPPKDRQLILNSEVNPPSLNLADRLNNWFHNLTNRSQPQPRSIELKSSPSLTPPQQLSPSPNLDPSITRSRRFERYLDLPQLPPITESDRDSTPGSKISPSASSNFLTKLQPHWFKQWVSYYQDYIYISDNNGEIVPEIEEFKLIPIESKYDIIELDPKSGLTRTTKNAAKQNRQLEYYPDWIETTAEEVGYSRSPLTRLLLWLDRIAVKIENWLIGIWNLLQNSSPL